MDNQESPTYYTSVALGRGREVSDSDFMAYVEGLISHSDPESLRRLSDILSREPWRGEVEIYRRQLEEALSAQELEDSHRAASAALERHLAARAMPGLATAGQSSRDEGRVVKLERLAILHMLREVLRTVLSRPPFAFSGDTRSSSTHVFEEIEKELRLIEDSLGLTEQGLSLTAVRSSIRKLQVEHANQQFELKALRETLEDTHRLVAAELDPPESDELRES